jgi:hypothetical protein
MARKKDDATTESAKDETEKKAADKKEAVPVERSEAETMPVVTRPDPKDLPAIEPSAPHGEPETTNPTRPIERSRFATATVGMPLVGDLGKPPEMPHTTAPPPLALGTVEDPTHMPGPKDVPAGSPEDPAPSPGHVPPGDSRSLRRGKEFALIYRVGTCVITRVGLVGTRGQWRVVEYPTSAFASSSYAKECSRFVSEGFSDYRE